jgi:Transglycosylase-like domain
MSPRTEHPPSTDDGKTRAKALRRAVIGGAAGVALLVGPVLLANVVVPNDDGGKVEAAAESETSLIAFQRDATQADNARAGALEALQTTTTLPPTTTTAPPPPTTEPPTTTTTEPPTTTEAPPEPGPVGDNSGGGFGDPNSYETWDALAECESGGNWAYSAGPYYGGLQFSLSTWQSVGGTGYPYEHSRETQIHFGQILQARSGWGQWPHCSSELGLR